MAERRLFNINIPSRPDKNAELEVASKVNAKKAPATRKGSGGLLELLARAKALVANLENHNYKTIRSKEELTEFIGRVNADGVVSIDTETTGLDPILDNIVGMSMSIAGEDVYIPINHKSYITHERYDNQLTEEEVAEALKLLRNDLFIVMFNATFDIRVIMNQVGVRLHCDWDCYLASRIMNENEPKDKRGLKALYHKYCEQNDNKALSYSDIFEGISFDMVPINVGYVYAANDSRITLQLYEFQKKYLYYDPECEPEDRNGMNGVSWVFFNLEMPCVDAVVDMENLGVKFDMDYNKELKVKYHKILDEREATFHKLCVEYGLSADINIGSVKQLQEALYDKLGLVAVDNKNQPTRSTDKKSLASITPKHPIVDAILDYRELTTIVNTFIDKLPDTVNPRDGRVHGKFNQYGADTGRFSSDKPNLQNIPSHNKDIRKMFTASDGYVLLSSDYSQQEPSCLASFCNSMGYPTLYNARKSGDDIYSHVASACFKVPYEECCEFDENGHKNPPEFKKRRADAKPVLLGILYGRGDVSVAEGMGITLEQAKQLKANLYKKYPEIKIFEDESIKMAETKGYVTTVCGRKRRLPSMTLPDYEIRWKDGHAPDLDPLAFDSDVDSDEVPYDIQRKWLTKIRRATYKRAVFEQANKEGLWVIDNTKDKDVTKVVNARIQGSAADLTKLAMIMVTKDERLKELGFRLLIQVHDELIGECPEENAKECARLLAEVMSKAAEKILKMPFKCDVEVSKEWYGESIEL